MVARSPPKQRREMAAAAMAPPRSDPTLLRETVKKVDKCMIRLQELQYTVAGGRKVISGSSVRFKQESLKTENGNPRRSPSELLPTNTEEWRRMSLPAMLLGETVGEILKATQFARDMVQATTSHEHDDPTTPEKMVRREKKASTEHHRQLQERRKREKQEGGAARSQSDTSLSSSSSQRAKSRIDFNKAEVETQICSSSRYTANRVSPRNRPWARKKVVLFPNPLFHSSPAIARNRPTPHTLASTSLANKSQRAAALLRRSFSPSRLAKRLVSPLNIRNGDGDAAKMRRSFSPSKLVSPFKGRRINGADNFMIGLKHRPASSQERDVCVL